MMRVKEFIKKRKIRAKLIVLKETVEMAKKAAKAANADTSQVVKTLLLKADNEVIGVLIPGNPEAEL